MARRRCRVSALDPCDRRRAAWEVVKRDPRQRCPRSRDERGRAWGLPGFAVAEGSPTGAIRVLGRPSAEKEDVPTDTLCRGGDRPGRTTTSPRTNPSCREGEV